MLTRRSLFHEVGLFREDLVRSQDYEMTLRLIRLAKFTFVPEVIFFQRQHAGVRGSAQDAFSSDGALQKWLIYDQKIFTRIRDEYDLKEFTPTFALHWDDALAKRAALVERACVFAKHALWAEAIGDFCQASKQSPVSVTPQELRLAEVVIRTFISWGVPCGNPELLDELRACYKMNSYSRRIIHAACRPLVWQARKFFQKGDILGGVKILRSLVSILGIRGAFSRVFSSLLF